jgi:hypothetical protein
LVFLLVHPEIPGIDLLKLYLGTPSPSSAVVMFLNAEITNKSAELGLTIPFGIDMLQAFVVPGVHDLDHRSSRGNISNLHFYF